jgi:hypothetical protein
LHVYCMMPGHGVRLQGECSGAGAKGIVAENFDCKSGPESQSDES